MPRVIVLDDQSNPLMNKPVTAQHLDDEHTAVDLLEELATAIHRAHKHSGEPLRRRGTPRPHAPYGSIPAG